MPIHPPPPDDLHGLLDAFEHGVQAVVDLGNACHEGDFDTPTECPGWTVKDQIAHVVGAEKALSGMPSPLAEPPLHAHPWEALGRLNAQDVEARRAVPGAQVVAELASYLPDRMEELRGSGATLDTVVGGFFGPETTFGAQLRRRIIDVWCHEQDIRAALDRPGNLDTAGARLFTAAILDELPRLVARAAHVPPGATVVLDVTGPVLARGGARVTTGADGRPFGEVLFSGHGHASGEGEEPSDVTTIHLTTEALTRRAAGRRSTEKIRYTVSGDDEVARRVLDALVVTG
ncbi:MAG TPA: maleylpyruvate isomerase family mycothiol-dependent enzyme [Intrasporangium sp.]|uniref:maleylpyruvate isomerase family mycothiol-dependent enzyme n=1 Tax=Intrasporangium sp. TaxID=1925024 RepID=UPI002D7661B3|nr:maleylpyruvate isomerase family mycothiol-dependent enzyme [Intrasporangium sp.]HET7398300.1 maleylpyruvate isomerase family mycothiol-dependent enzyme [Intrasporangium sp.]